MKIELQAEEVYTTDHNDRGYSKVLRVKCEKGSFFIKDGRPFSDGRQWFKTEEEIQEYLVSYYRNEVKYYEEVIAEDKKIYEEDMERYNKRLQMFKSKVEALER